MFRKIVYPVLALLLATSFVQAEVVRVENPSGDGAMAPGLATLPDGSGAILSWIEKEGDLYALKFSRFAGGDFSAPREIAQGHDWFANWADTPAVHVRPDGLMFAHWLEKSASSTYAYDIQLVHSLDAGQTWSPPETPHSDGTPTEHGFVSYFSTGRQASGMVWLDGRRTLSGGTDGHEHSGYMTLRTAMMDADGAPGPDQLLDPRVCDCCQTASGVTATGPIVAYRNRTEEEIRDIAVVRRTADGWTEPLIVHADGWEIGGCPVNGPALLASGERVVVAWFTMADDSPKVRFSISTDAGASFDPPVTRSAGTALGRVQLAWLDDGFVLGWMDEKDGARLRVARYSPDGELLEDLTLTEMDQGRISGFPRIVAIDDRLLVAWTAGGASNGAKTGTRVMTALVDLDRPRN